ncbi:hypothetical protein APE_0424.1 [Aeropyrum pernix K1]|uniref:DUF2069 domain-containing protein n=1 Tax=Aeropyrum pernix (strain ATCC 700893 / DSM 11879 / JCM 9820 / NBRC 100138 / K1) TaxID=272557 RepID=Q9YF14_AERPE|nr:hypothetical protein [Aeropyrum pernix]BAA79382.2 hypothetical protein APE_0424.1 [Aeropyrum pernix K1]
MRSLDRGSLAGLALVAGLSAYLIIEGYMAAGGPTLFPLAVAALWVGGAAAIAWGRAWGLYPFMLGCLGFIQWRLLAVVPGEGGLRWVAEVSLATLLWFVATFEVLRLWLRVRRGRV